MKLSICGLYLSLPGIAGMDEYAAAVYRGTPVSGAPFVATEAEMFLEALHELQPTSRHCGLITIQGSRIIAAAAARYQRTLGSISEIPPGDPLPDWAEICPLHCDVSAAGIPISAALRQAEVWLSGGEVEEVLILGIAQSTALSELLAQANLPIAATPGFSLGRGAGICPAGGWAAIRLRLGTESPDSQNPPSLATIQAHAHLERSGTALKPHIVPMFVHPLLVESAAREALGSAGWQPDQVGYLDVMASGFGPVDVVELSGLAHVYGDGKAGAALGSSQNLTGYHPALDGIMGIIQAVTLLGHRFLPPVSGWNGPQEKLGKICEPFHVPIQPVPWFQRSGKPGRSAGVSRMGWDGSAAHILLTETETRRPQQASFLVRQPAEQLFLFSAETADQLLEKVDESLTIEQDVFACQDLAQESVSAYQQHSQLPFTLALVAGSPTELMREIRSAARGIRASLQNGSLWQSPNGSTFTPDPLGAKAEIAFVYPGAFNSYPGLGRDLLTLFPRLWDVSEQFTSDMARMTQAHLLYPQRSTPFSGAEMAAIEQELVGDAAAMIISGSLYAMLFTRILRDDFRIHPRHVFGYSLGEIGMLYALGIWSEADFAGERLKASPIFHDQLTRSHTIVAANWGLPPGAPPPAWENYFLMASPEQVREAMHGLERLYLTHINTPRQTVVAGDARACQELLARLKCMSVRAPYDFALHCPAMAAAQGELTRLLTLPVDPVQSDVQMYTALGHRPIPMQSEKTASTIAEMLCSPLDFLSLVRSVRANGAQVFLELGPNANCSRWIEESLKGEKVLAAGINRRGVSDWLSLLRLLARLAAHRIPMDLSPLAAR